MSAGLHARPATALAGAESEGSFTRTESALSRSRQGRAAYEAERRSAVPIRRDFLVVYRRKVFQSGGVFSPHFSFPRYSLFCCGATVRCCIFSFVHINLTMYAHACSVRVVLLDVAWSSWPCRSPVGTCFVCTICSVRSLLVSESVAGGTASRSISNTVYQR